MAQEENLYENGVSASFLERLAKVYVQKFGSFTKKVVLCIR